MKKTYVLDTNVLIQAPYALRCFEEHTVVLPLVVLEELDGLKKAEGERGANARTAIRMLEELRLRAAFCALRRILCMWSFRRIFRRIRRTTGF